MPTRESETNFRRFVAGSLSGTYYYSTLWMMARSLSTLSMLSSGTMSVCCTYPLEVVRVRLAYITRSHEDGTKTLNTNTNASSSPSSSSSSSRPTLRTAISEIYHETTRFKPSSPLSPDLHSSSTKALRTRLFYHLPLASFYRGFTVTLLGMVPYAGTSFLTWGYLRSLLLPPPTPSHPKPKATPLADLVIGAIAGATAQTVSYPFEIVRRRMQVGGLTNPDPRAWLTFGETVRRVWGARGWRGFYVGLGIGLAKVVPMTATSFAVWQWGKRVLGV